VVCLIAVWRQFWMEPLEEGGTMGGKVGWEGGAGIGCVAVAVEVLVKVAMVSW
jgi:hypothetical protein